MADQSIPYLNPEFVSRLGNIDIKARLIVEGFITGLHKSPYHGFSVEFAEHRPYNPGQPLKSIDWKVYAKTGKLYSKRFEEETNLRCNVVLDQSDSMRYPIKGISKLEYGAYLAGALQYLMVSQHDAAGLTLFDSQIRYQTRPKARKSMLLPSFLELERVVRQKDFFQHKTASADVLHTLAQQFGQRSFVILITDFLDNLDQQEAIFKALQHLRHQKHEILIFFLLDKKTEEDFVFPDRPTVLKDLESGEELTVQPGQIRKVYQEAVHRFKDKIRRRCRDLSVDLVEVDIQTSYDKVLTDYLIKRKKLTR